MIILDTNVLSESLKAEPSRTVLRWLAAQERSRVFITTITQAEVLYGLKLLQPGQRRTRLLAAAEEIFAIDFERKILPFDQDAARNFAGIVSGRRVVGRPISQFDAMIASIARVHGAVVATRDTTDFRNCGIEIINPWAE